MKARDLFLFHAAVVLLPVLWASAASAQSAGLGCALQAVAGTSRHVLACPSGVRITAEAGARYTLTDRDQDGSADGVVLRSKALLLEVPAVTRGGFVVVTPGSGVMRIIPVSVCHHVSTIGQRSPPMCSWYHIHASGLIGSPTDPSSRSDDRSCAAACSVPHFMCARIAVGAV